MAPHRPGDYVRAVVVAFVFLLGVSDDFHVSAASGDVRCTTFIGFKLPLSGASWWQQQVLRGDATSIMPQLWPLTDNLEEQGNSHIEKMRRASHCHTNDPMQLVHTGMRQKTHHHEHLKKGHPSSTSISGSQPRVAGFTTNPLANSLTDFHEFVREEEAAGTNVKLVQYVRNNVVKQALSFVVKKAESDCRDDSEDCDVLPPVEGDLGPYHIVVFKFAASLAAQVKMRIDLDGFMEQFKSEFHVMSFEAMVRDKERELEALFGWMGEPDLYTASSHLQAPPVRKIKGDNVRELVDNFDELWTYVQSLEVPEEVCPLLQMLETTALVDFPQCDYEWVLRVVESSKAMQKGNAKFYMENAIRYHGTSFSGDKFAWDGDAFEIPPPGYKIVQKGLNNPIELVRLEPSP
jgi:hypothetical protein